MKKVYLSLLGLCLTVGAATAQQTMSVAEMGNANQITAKPVHNVVNAEKAIIWTEDFANGLAGNNSSTVQTWTTGGVDGAEWKHSFYTTSGSYSTGTDPFMSTTNANGFMLWDEDSINTADNGFQNPGAWLPHTGELISPVIDLTGNPNVVLELEQDFRYCCSGSGHDLNVSISTDGGSTWGTPIDLTDGAGANDAFLTYNGNSYMIQRNISAEAGGNMVNLKFTWDGAPTGNLAYYWALDDINIVDQPTDDLQMLSAYFVGDNNEGVEYGRTPVDMQDANYIVGAQVYNFGANDQTNNVMTADVNSGAFVSTSNDALIESDSTRFMESTETPGFGVGMYTADYSVISDNETAASPEYGNNTGVREFEVTDAATTATEYSIDGIDIYTNPSLAAIGTNSFTGGEDGLVLAALYSIKTAANVSGIRVMLSSQTVAGGEIYGSIKDTSTFFANDMTSIAQCNPHTVTAADVTAGFVDLWFPSLVNLPASSYYAAVELYSNGNANDIRVLDDETVEQPFYGSMIYLPGDQVYSNGTGIGVRMLMGDWSGLEEASLNGVTIYPNPSEGIVTVTNTAGSTNDIVVYDLTGRVITTKTTSTATTIDLSSVQTGTYIVKVSNENGSMTRNVVIK